MTGRYQHRTPNRLEVTMVHPDVASGAATAGSDEVEIRVPADTVQLPLLRAVTASVAGQQDFDLDQIADLRMAVDELCATLLKLGTSGTLVCRFRTTTDSVEIRGTVPCESATTINENSFGWHVLTALTDRMRAWSAPREQAPGSWLHVEATKLRQ